MSYESLPAELTDLSQPYDRRFKRWEVVVLTAWLSLLLIVLATALVWVFPGDLAGAADWGKNFKGRTGLSLTSDQIVLLTAALAGALGGTLHALGSAVYHRAKCDLTIKWGMWYVVRPLLGAGLAIGFTVVIRGGFTGVSLSGPEAQTPVAMPTPAVEPATLAQKDAAALRARTASLDGKPAEGPLDGSATSDVAAGTPTITPAVLLNPYAVAAIGLLVGLFNAQAMSKLKKIAVALFEEEPTGKEPPKKDPLDARAPELAELNPSQATVGSNDLPLAVLGEAFMDGDVVLIDGKPQPTEFVSENELTATIPTASLAAAGELRISVRRPQPRPMQSNELTFKVT